MKIGLVYRIALFCLISAVMWATIIIVSNRIQLEANTNVIQQVTNPSNENTSLLQGYGYMPSLMYLGGSLCTLILFGMLLWSPLSEFLKTTKDKISNVGKASLLVFILPLLWGCAPYDAPEYAEIGNSETGFLVQMSGDAEQGKFESKEYLDARKVATKRVRILHESVSTGRMWWDVKYQPTHRLIVVDRAPITREWQPSPARGTGVTDQGIWVESKDSVGFSTGITLTSMVTEEDASTFLYHYPTGSLQKVADSEIRARVQKIFAEQAAIFDMSDLREKKGEIIKAIEQDIVVFFKSKGITITTVGMSGGFTYENPKIQESIDQVFIAQREKEVNAAKLEAQTDANARIESEAKATANAAMEKARGEAEGQKLILVVAKEASTDPVFLQLKQLEVEMKRIEKWDGKYPQWYMGGAGEKMPMTMMLEAPKSK